MGWDGLRAVSAGVPGQPPATSDSPLALSRSSRERQQGDIPRLLDGRAQAALMRRAHAGQAARHDLAAFGDKLRQQTHIFVIDGFDLLGAELAHFLAAEVLAASRTALAGAAGAARPRRTSL